MSPLRVAVIGVGKMGKLHVQHYHAISSVKLVAVADPNQEAGRSAASDSACKYYESYQELLANEELDFVSIAVPSTLHKEVALACISKGVHVLVEKPIAGSLADARVMITAAEAHGVKLGVGHVERFNPAVLRLKEIISSGQLGEVNSIITRRVGVYPPQIKDANVIVDLAVHDIDIVNALLERLPERLVAHGGHSIVDSRHDFANLFLAYGAASVLIQVNWITPVKIRKINITGSKGYAELDYVTQEITLFESMYHKTVDNFGDFIVKFGAPNKIEVGVAREEPLKLELLDFIEFIKGRKDFLVTPQQALTALEIALKADHFIKADQQKFQLI